jgi:hypothetical protein
MPSRGCTLRVSKAIQSRSLSITRVENHIAPFSLKIKNFVIFMNFGGPTGPRRQLTKLPNYQIFQWFISMPSWW